jgi:hypothetical protein
VQILVGVFSDKVGKDIFKLTVGNKNIHEISNGNAVKVVNFSASKNLMVRSRTFPHRNVQKYAGMSSGEKTQSN